MLGLHDTRDPTTHDAPRRRAHRDWAPATLRCTHLGHHQGLHSWGRRVVRPWGFRTLWTALWLPQWQCCRHSPQPPRSTAHSCPPLGDPQGHLWVHSQIEGVVLREYNVTTDLQRRVRPLRAAASLTCLQIHTSQLKDNTRRSEGLVTRAPLSGFAKIKSKNSLGFARQRRARAAGALSP